jgi:acetoin utilization deacetylase AcuC-like enzyme
MKIVFHEQYYDSTYAADPAASTGRLDGIMEIINKKSDVYEVITPDYAAEEDILRAHTKSHLDRIMMDRKLFDLASLAAGGSIMAAMEGYKGNPAFAVVRPPGHHASSDSCWGFCYFNNLSISLLKLYSQQRIKTAYVLDFDLHTGDGNINILEGRGDGLKVKIQNPMAGERQEYIKEVDRYMNDLEGIDIFVASAGFDQGVDDWGGLLHPEDYKVLGQLMKEYSEKLCGGRRYALLEGGYNHDVIGINVDAFCQGFM